MPELAEGRSYGFVLCGSPKDCIITGKGCFPQFGPGLGLVFFEGGERVGEGDGEESSEPIQCFVFSFLLPPLGGLLGGDSGGP